jgi:GST-like protein
MIDLYALTSPNVQKIYIALEELGLPYRERFIDVWKGEQFSREFLELNPNSKIPVIVDHEGPDGEAFTVFESGAILLYLAEKTGRLIPSKTRERYEVVQWLMIQLTGIGPAFGNYTHFSRFAAAGNAYSVSRYQTEMLRLYDVLEARLGKVEYLGGVEYSIADIATFPWTRGHDSHGVHWREFPNLKRWFEAIEKRDAVQRALAKVVQIASSRDTASAADLDRIFGRGEFARAAGA